MDASNTSSGNWNSSPGNDDGADPVPIKTHMEVHVYNDNLAYIHDEENGKGFRNNANDGPDQGKSKLSKLEESGTDEPKEPILYTQIFGTIVAASSFFTVGTVVGLPSATLPQLTNPTSDNITLNTKEVAIYSSIIFVGGILGCAVGGIMTHWIGRRVTLLMIMPFVLSLWIALVFSPFVWMILLIRLTQGITLGIISVPGINYVTEIAHSSIRGRLSGAFDTCKYLGILLTYIIGSFNLTWRQMCFVIGIITTIPTFLGLIFLPNSPRWLVMKGRIEEAKKALAFYRGSIFDVDRELSSIIDQHNKTSSSQMGIIEQLRKMGSPDVYPRIIILTILTVLSNFSGSIVIATFNVPIFLSVDDDINPYHSAITVGILRVAGMIVFIMTVDRLKRKTILTITGIVCSISLVTTAILFHMETTSYWSVFSSIILYTPSAVFTEASVTLLRSEIFPTALRSLCCSLLFILFYLTLFASTETFPIITENTGESVPFWIYAGSGILFTMFVVFSLPETKGLSLEEIDNKFRIKHKS